MPYIKFSDDDLYRANTANLVSYLEGRGERVKLKNLQNAMTAGLEQLRKPSQTIAELKITARKLYDIADCALRLGTEETLVQQAEQKETSEEAPSDGSFKMAIS